MSGETSARAASRNMNESADTAWRAVCNELVPIRLISRPSAGKEAHDTSVSTLSQQARGVWTCTRRAARLESGRRGKADAGGRKRPKDLEDFAAMSSGDRLPLRCSRNLHTWCACKWRSFHAAEEATGRTRGKWRRGSTRERNRKLRSMHRAKHGAPGTRAQLGAVERRLRSHAESLRAASKGTPPARSPLMGSVNC